MASRRPVQEAPPGGSGTMGALATAAGRRAGPRGGERGEPSRTGAASQAPAAAWSGRTARSECGGHHLVGGDAPVLGSGHKLGLECTPESRTCSRRRGMNPRRRSRSKRSWRSAGVSTEIRIDAVLAISSPAQPTSDGRRRDPPYRPDAGWSMPRSCSRGAAKAAASSRQLVSGVGRQPGPYSAQPSAAARRPRTGSATRQAAETGRHSRR